MGRGTIISGGAGGLYTIVIRLNRVRIDNRIAAIDKGLVTINVDEIPARNEDYLAAKSSLNLAMSKMNQAIADYGEGLITQDELKAFQKTAAEKISDCDKKKSKLDSLKLRKLSLEKEKNYLQANMPADETVQAWCADLTASLAGDVGTIEVPGERAGVPVVIHPGYNNAAIFDAIRDGQLQPAIDGTPAGVFYNRAMMPGWQKWKPIYRLGTIIAIDHPTDTCSVMLNGAVSSQQGLDVNQIGTLVNVPIQYMECNSAAFDIDDRVVVKFTGQDVAAPVVVGFESNPKACVIGKFIAYAQDDSQILGNYLFDRSTGSWVAAFTTLVVGDVDWKGKKASDVLSFKGPRSRYFFAEGVFGGSNFVYRKGMVWTSAGIKVLGAAIAVYDGVRYLNVAVYDHASYMLSVMQRVEAEQYLNDDPYDAATNPQGWKTVAQYDLNGMSPSTIFAFNASGTECQGIIGYEDRGLGPLKYHTRVKLQINGEAVTRTDYVAPGRISTSGIQHADFTPTFTVNIGTDNGNCSAAKICLAQGDCGLGPACVHWAVDTLYESVYHYTSSFTYMQNSPTVICADYIGDTEILGMLKRDTSYVTTSGREDYSRHMTADDYYSSPDCALNQVITDDSSYASLSNMDQLTELYFEAGGIRIPLSYGKLLSTINITATNTTGTYDSNVSTKEFYCKINYLDLRHQHASFSELEGNAIVTETGSGTYPFSSALNRMGTYNYRAVTILGGTRYISTDRQDPDNATGNHTIQAPNPKASCTPTITDIVEPSWWLDDPNIGWSYMHPYGVKDDVPPNYSAQGYATDTSGNVFASQTIWELQTDGSYLDKGMWNYLTGGDPVLLTNLTGTNPRFFPIGILSQ